MKFIYNILEILLGAINFILLLAVWFIIYIITFIVFIVTYEFGKNKIVTKRKIRRIRNITKYKIKIYREYPYLAKWLGIYGYLETVNKKFKY